MEKEKIIKTLNDTLNRIKEESNKTQSNGGGWKSIISIYEKAIIDAENNIYFSISDATRIYLEFNSDYMSNIYKIMEFADKEVENYFKNRKEFEEWLENNNFKTIYSCRRKYVYANTRKFAFSTVCTPGDGMFGCFYEGSKWELISYEPKTDGDIPQRDLLLSSNEEFDTEEEALNVLKNKLITDFANYNQCFICHSRFTINTRNIPSNQKTFYYKCPNCDAELKFGNPNYKEELTNRDKLIKAMELPNNIKSLSEEEKNKIICENIINISKLLKEFQCDDTEYELSKRQQATKNNAINDIKAKSFLEAYYEITDFVDDYGDRHNGKIFATEKKEINNLISIIYNNIK